MPFFLLTRAESAASAMDCSAEITYSDDAGGAPEENRFVADAIPSDLVSRVPQDGSLVGEGESDGNTFSDT